MLSIAYSRFWPDFEEKCMDCIVPIADWQSRGAALVAAPAWEGLPSKATMSFRMNRMAFDTVRYRGLGYSLSDSASKVLLRCWRDSSASTACLSGELVCNQQRRSQTAEGRSARRRGHLSPTVTTGYPRLGQNLRRSLLPHERPLVTDRSHWSVKVATGQDGGHWSPTVTTGYPGLP